MTQPGDRARLADESPDHPGMLQEGFPEEFHGDLAARPVPPRLVHLPHPPGADQPPQQEVVGARAGAHRDRPRPVPPEERDVRQVCEAWRGPADSSAISTIDPQQLRPDLLPSLAESGQELRVRWPITPSAPHPILLADELQGQAVQGDQLRELLDIICQRGGPDGAGVPPAIFQVDADELDEQAVPLGAGRWRETTQGVRDLARTAKAPGLLEAEDSRFEFLVRHRRAVPPAGSRIRASDRRTERSERPVSSAISEICRPCSRSSSTRLPKGSRLREHPFQLVGQGDRVFGGGIVRRAEEPPFIDPIEGDLDPDRPAVRTVAPGLSEQLVFGDGRQEPPEIAPSIQGVAAPRASTKKLR